MPKKTKQVFEAKVLFPFAVPAVPAVPCASSSLWGFQLGDTLMNAVAVNAVNSSAAPAQRRRPIRAAMVFVLKRSHNGLRETQPCNARGEASILILSKYGMEWNEGLSLDS